MGVGGEGCFDDGLQPEIVSGWHFLVGRVTGPCEECPLSLSCPTE